jgi:hypothetical protein
VADKPSEQAVHALAQGQCDNAWRTYISALKPTNIDGQIKRIAKIYMLLIITIEDIFFIF